MGSSPLARGLLRVQFGVGPLTRIIPARAGFTPSRAVPRAPDPDHPRSRGVYSGWRGLSFALRGSSPLARGLPSRFRVCVLFDGIIPARAGFTRVRDARHRPPANHPRSRGVYSICRQAGKTYTGSSPLARGLPVGFDVAPHGGRIIPARAGFTSTSRCTTTATSDHPRSRGVYPRPRPRTRPGGDHPRSRGVYEARRWGTPTNLGSSPLARGLRRLPDPPGRPAGIIPARAGFTLRLCCARRWSRDHPRSRGVYPEDARIMTADGGSSPLARGLHQPDGRYRGHGRIIPARAGFTTTCSTRSSSTPDHPRSRGVYSELLRDTLDAAGSSPLARGLRPVRRPGSPGRRIIPARAGFTRFVAFRVLVLWDHPRSRGVYGTTSVIGIKSSGSSPLARGLPPHTRWVCCPARIIPARAGFTCATHSIAQTARDHPRSRGVYCGCSAGGCGHRGSSPLARGLRRPAPGGPGQVRIIPARAGFTPASGAGRRGSLDHPRSRGVYPSSTNSAFGKSGSSPLARGLRSSCRRAGRQRRIIPARAGFTAEPEVVASEQPDHPRSRGVYDPAGPIREVLRGSSPLARGLPRSASTPPPRRRIIPARAGFTATGKPVLLYASDHPRSRGVYVVVPAGDHVPGERGIIPARAGFTCRSPPPGSYSWDHPRSRGVYGQLIGAAPDEPGSSPLARGLPCPRAPDPYSRGIIPARAGFTGPLRPTSAGFSDHPRSRGVYAPPREECRGGQGSSPLARGLHGAAARCTPRPRIIPARAGFTRPDRPLRRRRTDHPRSRGVYVRAPIFQAHPRGSSPLARGLRSGGSGPGRDRGIIPARAGFTGRGRSLKFPLGDHPRSRGVYSMASPTPTCSPGSSPLARGLRPRRPALLLAGRIIPARAGFTRT